MKNTDGIKILIIAALALIILSGTGAAVSLSNSGGGTWKYQRDISIKENSGTVLTDYEVLIELKGADFPGEAKSDGGDIRFTDSNSNELNYWIESWDYAGKNAKVWVKVPSIAAGSTTVIRIYYGNPSAISSSNGDATFLFFDDFKNELLGSEWRQPDNTHLTVTESGSKLNLNGRGAVVTSISPADKAVDVKLRYVSGEKLWGARGGIVSRKSFSEFHYIHDRHFENPYATVWEYNNGLESAQDYHSQNSGSIQWYKYTAKFKGSSSSILCFNDICESPRTVQYPALITNGFIGLGVGFWACANWFCPGSYDFEDFRIRKFTFLEPTVILASIKSSSLSITKSASPYSLRQFQESTIKVRIENSGTSEVKAIEIMDSIYPIFDLTGGDFPNPKKFDIVRTGESRELQYTIKSKESGAFTLDAATVTYADSEGNIQEVKSEPVSIKVVPSSEGSLEISSPSDIGSSSAVLLHGEKTDVVLGEDILLKLSAVNLITKPPMNVQVILYPPSGMSLTGSEFVKSGAGIYTTTYTLNPGDGKDIGVHIKSNQVGDFNVKGRIVHYFGEEKDKAEDHTLNLPIKVRKEPGQTAPVGSADEPVKAPGFEAISGILALLLIIINKRKWI